MKTLTYFIRNKYYGQTPVSAAFSPLNLAYFCPTCGEIWARVVSSESSYWNIENVPCESHAPAGVPDWGRIPGALTLSIHYSHATLAIPFWGRAVEQFPPEVLKREFNILLNQYERNYQ